MNYLPRGNEEKELIKFVAEYQILSIKDEKYFFNSKRYYRDRVANLIEKKYLKRLKRCLILDEQGIEYAKINNLEYNATNRNVKYQDRLLRISNLGAFYYNCNLVDFIPSFSIKDKTVRTTTGRKFVGILDINGIEYLTYQIAKEHDYKYISTIIGDIQRESDFKNLIILVDNISKIKTDEFTFGNNQVLIVRDTIVNREKLKYMHSVRWDDIIRKYYRNRVYYSKYNFCDYTDYRSRYVSFFYFFDTEKVNRIKYFLRENDNKNADIICNADVEKQLQRELPDVNYYIVDLEEYIDKERNIYD